MQKLRFAWRILGALFVLAGLTQSTGMAVRVAAQGTIPPFVALNLNVLGHLGGPVSAVAVDDSHIYAGFGMEFAVLAPSPTLHRVGYTLLPNTIRKVVVDGTYAYVLADGALNIVDIADPQRPMLVVSEYPRLATDSQAITNGDLAVRDHRAYLRSGQDLYIINVEDSRHPAILYESHDPSQQWSNLEVQGNYLYQAYGCRELVVWDISQPSSPALVASLPQESGYGSCTTSGLVVRGDTAYVSFKTAYQGGRFAVVDVSAPSHPAVITLPSIVLPSGQLVLEGAKLYLAGELGQFIILDVSNRGAPNVLSEFDVHGSISAIAARNARIYLGSRPRIGQDSGRVNSVLALDVLLPTEPAVIDVYTTPADALFMVARDAFVYLVDAGKTLWIIDGSNPANPHTEGYLPLEQSTGTPAVNVVDKKAVVTNDYLYLSASASGDPTEPADELWIVSVTDPVHPQRIARIPISFHGLDAKGGLLYLATCSGILVYDQSNPAQPTLKGRFQTIGCARDIHVVTPYAYVYDDIGQIWVLDVSDPTQPTAVGSASLFLGSTGFRVYVEQNRLYVYQRWSRLHVFDIGDSTKPKPVGILPVSGTSFAVDGDYIYDFGSGPLHLIDAADPGAPVSLGYYDFPRARMYGSALALADGVVYVGFWPTSGGLALLQRSDSLLWPQSYLPFVAGR